MAGYAFANPPYELLPRRIKLRTAMHVIPGNVIDAGVTEIVRCFQWRSLYHRFAYLIRQTVEDAPGAREEPASVMVMPGE